MKVMHVQGAAVVEEKSVGNTSKFCGKANYHVSCKADV